MRPMNYGDYYKIGKIGKPHGVGGEVSMMFVDDVFDRDDADHLMLSIDGLLVPFFIEEYRFKGSETALMKFCDVDTQDAARELTGCDVYYERQADGDADGLLSWHALVGMTLVDAATGRAVGTITEVDDATANLLFGIDTGSGDTEYVPAHEDLIASVDTEERTVTMNIPEGLLP